ncbi:MAG: Ribonuclease E [Phycisphaerae bacterium]|nr:Ribonuclease E [Phycisphaerae bacterium]
MSNKEMLINAVEGEEVRIAVVQDGRLEELYMERTSAESHVGNIYKGKVVNVEPSIQAAFIDFGEAKNGFLHISDLQPQYFPGPERKEEVGKKTSRRDRPPIQKCLRRGQEIIVQVTKEGIGTKGPTLTSYLSIPGRFLVLMPGMSKLGVSRKIEDDEARRAVRKVLEELTPPKNMGFIVRTAGVGRPKRELQRDLNYLTRLWNQVAKKIKSDKAPAELYQESDLVIRTVRDVLNTEIDRIVVDSEKVMQRVSDFMSIAMPRAPKGLLEHYSGPEPLFHKYNIEAELERINSRHVDLPNGGSLVIDQTEALVAIDVNSGKYRSQADAERTAFLTDMAAADEVCRQLRLRDLGGVIVIDFIDLRDRNHQRDLEHKLRDLLKKDRARTEFTRMSRFGLVEMTRQRMRPSLKRSLYQDCPHCNGSGLIKTPESLSFDVMRTIQYALVLDNVSRLEVTVSPVVGQFLNNRKRRLLVQLEDQTRKQVLINIDENFGADEVRYNAVDHRGATVQLDARVQQPVHLQQRQREQQRRRQQEQERDVARDLDREDESGDSGEDESGAPPQQSDQPAAEGSPEQAAAPQQDGQPRQEGEQTGEKRRGRRRRRRGGRRRNKNRDKSAQDAAGQPGDGQPTQDGDGEPDDDGPPDEADANAEVETAITEPDAAPDAQPQVAETASQGAWDWDDDDSPVALED